MLRWKRSRTPGRIRFWVLSRRKLAAAGAAAAAAAILWVVNYPAAVGVSAAVRQLPIYCVQREQKVVAISFDAAWGDGRMRQCLAMQGTAVFAQIILLAF